MYFIFPDYYVLCVNVGNQHFLSAQCAPGTWALLTCFMSLNLHHYPVKSESSPQQTAPPRMGDCDFLNLLFN